MITINILGSCVCRDIFNYDTEGIFSVGKYTNGASVLSLTAPRPKIALNIEDFQLRSNFEKRSAWLDYSKTAFDYVENEGKTSDYLVISLSDCRMDMAEIWNTDHTERISFTSFGTTFRENYQQCFSVGKMKGTSVEIYKALNLPLFFFEEALGRYAEKLLSVYEERKIIVIEDFFAEKYAQRGTEGLLSFGNEEYVYKINRFYKYLYSCLYRRIHTNVIPFLPKTIGDAGHKLGLFGLHYVPEFYRYALDSVRAIVCGEYSPAKAERIQKRYTDEICHKYYSR